MGHPDGGEGTGTWLEHIEASIRGVNSRMEKLESDTVRLGQELARLRDSRQADQERLRHDLSIAVEAVSSPTREIHELRAQLVSLAGAMRGLQATEHALDNQQEDTARRIENVWARIESFEGRLDENRRTAERAVADVALLRTELGRTVDALHTIRDNQLEHAEATRTELDALHEAGVEPAHRLARLEEARRAEESVLERIHVALGNLATVDQSAMAGLEKLTRLVAENEAGLRGEIGRMRDELESAIHTLRQISDERVVRQQSEITSALGAANQALDAISRYSDASNRLRSQLEGTIHQLQVGERKHLERALDHATQELRAYDERNQVDGAGPQE